MKLAYPTWLELPLLVKELNEMAARRRTYILRFVYATVLFAVSCLVMYSEMFQSGSLTGRGRAMLDQLVLIQFLGVCLFLPAMVSGALTTEKEHNALSLLLITTLRPWQIVVQKYISHLVPMLTFLFLSFPLMAVAYSFGGVNEDHLWAAIVLLVLACLTIGALSLMCSAYFPTTAEAFIGSYVLLAVLLFVAPVVWVPRGMAEAAVNGFGNVMPGYITVNLALIGVFLAAARGFVVTRAFVTPRNFVLEVFRWLDNVFNDANAITGGIVLVKDKDVLPGSNPIAWRETRKKSLGAFRYLFRVVAVLELPILFVCQTIRLDVSGSGRTGLSTLLYISWVVSLGLIAVQGTGAISAERSRQTLDVLLATPITGRNIIRQKVRGQVRMFAILFIPFFTIFFFEDWWYDFASKRYLIFSTLSVLVYMPLVAWLSVWIGLWLRSHIRAILCALGSMVAVAALPILVRQALPLIAADAQLSFDFLLLVSPVDVVTGIEEQREEEAQPWILYGIHLGLCAILAAIVRWRCLANADRRLGRIPEHTERLQFEVEPQQIEAAMA